jgi:hypothetical protein
MTSSGPLGDVGVSDVNTNLVAGGFGTGVSGLVGLVALTLIVSPSSSGLLSAPAVVVAGTLGLSAVHTVILVGAFLRGGSGGCFEGDLFLVGGPAPDFDAGGVTLGGVFVGGVIVVRGSLFFLAVSRFCAVVRFLGSLSPDSCRDLLAGEPVFGFGLRLHSSRDHRPHALSDFSLLVDRESE